MSAVLIDDYAQRLYSAQGDKAEYEAAQRERQSAAKGDLNVAEQWRKVRAAIRLMRGPSES